VFNIGFPEMGLFQESVFQRGLATGKHPACEMSKLVRDKRRNRIPDVTVKV
jgi:hypothetical protein